MKLTKTNSDYAERKIGECVSSVLGMGLRRATAYIAGNLTVKASAQRRPDKRSKSITVLVTVGAPNFAERRFIRVCKKAGMVFPLRQIQFKWWPKR